MNLIGILEIDGHDVFRIWTFRKTPSYTVHNVFYDRKSLLGTLELTHFGTQEYKQLRDINHGAILLCDEVLV